METNCIFCRIIAGQEQSWKVYEDEAHVGFLTPYPNTPGFTVLITKEHHESNVLHLDEARYLSMLRSARILAHRLESKLGARRIALVIEGMGVDHAHIKLIPMHGIPDGPWQPIHSNEPTMHETYQGFIATHDGPRMSDERLDAIRRQIAE
ncbi:MAG: HIT family protein [Bacteroidetes bacterium]|nr:HIT family protein [Bacteroidota bacterium]